MSNRRCSGAFLKRENKYLFGKRSADKLWYAGMWDVIGGFAEGEESPVDVLKRELQEELGITPTHPQLITASQVEEDTMYYLYLVTEWTGGEPANNSEEHSEIKWFTREELNDIELASAHYLPLIDQYVLHR